MVVLVVGAGVWVTAAARKRTAYERSAEIDAIAGRPPAPRFSGPVDYVAWMDAQHAAGERPGWSEAYSRFWPGPRAADEGMRKPPGEVGAKLRALGNGPE